MLMVRHAASAAIAFACLSSAALAAEREPVTAHVSTAGVDLASAQGRALFQARIARIAAAACDNGERDLGFRADADRCAREMTRDAQAQIAALARAGQRTAFADQPKAFPAAR
ncbi:MAG: UrcA family protein [Sphingomonadaceae bacterium]|nr:UrcA family protein [Sphingomonadaceae bacterium]